MAYEKTSISPKKARETYESVLNYLSKGDFKITHKRDFAWLVQATREVKGKIMQISITCRPGTLTFVTVSCLTSETQPNADEMGFVDSVSQELLDRLNA